MLGNYNIEQLTCTFFLERREEVFLVEKMSEPIFFMYLFEIFQ